MDGGASWSEYRPLATEITLNGLADGSYSLWVCGQDSNGNVQDESLATKLEFIVRGVAYQVAFSPALTTDGTANHQQRNMIFL